MAIYLARSCPMCRGYLGVVIQRDETERLVRAIDAHCLKCSWRLDWKLILGKRKPKSLLVTDRALKSGTVTPKKKKMAEPKPTVTRTELMVSTRYDRGSIKAADREGRHPGTRSSGRSWARNGDVSGDTDAIEQ
jgi:hypothetical protein